jgi:hypothetical protein
MRPGFGFHSRYQTPHVGNPVANNKQAYRPGWVTVGLLKSLDCQIHIIQMLLVAPTLDPQLANLDTFLFRFI